MTTILEKLAELTGALLPAKGTTPAHLADARCKVAAVLIQNDPTLLPVPNDPNVDPALHKAAVDGEKLAKKWDDEGIRRRFAEDEYLAADPGAELPVETIGPFVNDDMVLVQIAFYEPLEFFKVEQRREADKRVVVLLPEGTEADPKKPKVWNIPEGTVWIDAARFVQGGKGLVGLRITSGTLEVGVVAVPADGVVIPADKTWKITVAPTAPPPASADGSDADGVTLTLPTELQIDSAMILKVIGPLKMSGFGDPLEFDLSSSAITQTTTTVRIPFTKPKAKWGITSNRRNLFSLHLSPPTAVSEPAWVLPISSTEPEEIGQARHGGSMTLKLKGGLRSQVKGMTRGSEWRETVMTVNAEGIEMRASEALIDTTIQLNLWRKSRSTVKVTGPADNITVRHASRRGGIDLAAFKGGRVVNGWDLPRAASGAPFEFDGGLTLLSLIREPGGTVCRTTVHGFRRTDTEPPVGYALENYYLHVRPPTQTALVGSGRTHNQLTEGHARLLFDVGLAQPMLADPYAANWGSDDLDESLTRAALSAVVSWPDDGVKLRSQLRTAVTSPSLFSDMLLLDVSGRQDQLGLGLSPRRDEIPIIDGNVLVWPLSDTRLLMAPQVLWEPVRVLENKKTGDIDEVVESKTQGIPTLAAAVTDTVELVSVRPREVAREIASSALTSRWWAVLFGLPFGMAALVSMGRPARAIPASPLEVLLNQPLFTESDTLPRFVSATQLRLRATGAAMPGGSQDPSRAMPGIMQQTENLVKREPPPPTNNLPSVLDEKVVRKAVNEAFTTTVPLHHVDLSGYGLSTFSDWRRATPDGEEDPPGVSQVRFDVVVGRTAYEVIQIHSRLWCPQARVVRTVIIERGNSGNVYRYDTGWVAVSDGDCQRYAPMATGVVNAYRNIRNIRIVPKPLIRVDATGWEWQEVLYDADLHLIPDPIGAKDGQSTPIRDHTGYILTSPLTGVPKAKQFAELMDELKRPIGGQVDASVRLGGTLAMQLAHLEVALASPVSDDPKFVLAVNGAPLLPRAGQWTVVAIEPTTDVTSVDQRLGLPVIKRENENDFIFRDPGTAYASVAREYGLLQSTPAARVLFPKARVNPAERDTVHTEKPYVADPAALALASSVFPKLPLTMRCREVAQFAVTVSDAWKMKANEYTFDADPSSLAVGGGWGISRDFRPEFLPPKLAIDVDSAAANPWALGVNQPDELKLNIEPFGDVVIIRSAFKAASGLVPGFEKPTIDFAEGKLADLAEILDSLKHFIGLGFNVDVDVSAGNGPTPSFLIHLAMRLRLPERTNERIDIGIGKLRGKFEVTGRLQASPSGATSGQLGVELSGDLQQAIIPGVLFAGGQFRFVAQITDQGKPVIELGFGTVASIGGSLIKGLLELEATVRYGYTLVPETLKPGVMLGIEARAKLLAGLIGFSFSADALARIERIDEKNVTVWCQLRVTATVQIAVLIEEEIDFQTEFRQKIPLEAVALAVLPGAVLPGLAAASAVLRS